MKKIIITAISCLFVIVSMYSQSEMVVGKWEGKLSVQGMEIEMSLEIESSENKYKAFLSVPVQGISKMKVENLKLTEDSIRFELPSTIPGNAHYSGNRNDLKIEGIFSQAGYEIPLNWAKKQISLTEELKEEIAEYKILVDSVLKLAHAAGVGVGIIKDGEVLIQEGFGYSDIENKTKVTDQTIFAIGSSSKAFTSTGVGKLVDEGKLEWDDKVNEYLTDFRLFDDHTTEEMQITDLLSHTSGLPRHDLMWYGTSQTRNELYNKLKYLKPNASFRSKIQYQNLMFMTAGVLIERVSGTSWENFTQENILNPLGMKSTSFSVNKMMEDPNSSRPYKVNEEEKIEKMEYRNLDAIGPAGSINSNISDMLKWVSFNLNLGKIGEESHISSNVMSSIHTPRVIFRSNSPYQELSFTAYAMGWFVTYYNGVKIVQHGGNIDGFSALVVLLPTKNMGMVFLSNQNGSAVPGTLSLKAIDMFVTGEPVDWIGRTYLKPEKEEEEEEEEKEEESNPEFDPIRELSSYTGEFEHPAYGMVKTTAKSGDLLIENGLISGKLTPQNPDIFLLSIEDPIKLSMKIQFKSDINGIIKSIHIPLESAIDPIQFDKIPEEITEDELKKYVGKYQMKSLVIVITLENKKLFLEPSGQPKFQLVNSSDHSFTVKELKGYSVQFVVENNKVVKAIMNQPNGKFDAKKIE